MGRLGRFSEERIQFIENYASRMTHRHTGALGEGTRMATNSFATGVVSRRALSNSSIVGPSTRIDDSIVIAPKLGTGAWRGRTAATAWVMAPIQHTKVFDSATVDTINVGGATSGLARIWGGIMFGGGATVGVSATAFTWAGATLVVPAGVATTGTLVNFLLFGPTV